MRCAKRFPLMLLTTALLLHGATGESVAQKAPTSSGQAATVDTPILRIPQATQKPKIDGQFSTGEWEDASALSGFWYDFTDTHGVDFRYMAPNQTQVEVYAAYGKEHLYLAALSPVYPKNTWFRARGRFPDVTHHAQYGLIWDDHIELELRPIEDNVEGFRKGLFKWFVNPIGTVADQHWTQQHGSGQEWASKVVARSNVTDQRWILEMRIPLERFRHGPYDTTDDQGEPLVKLPPPDGTTYRAWFVRGIGGNGRFFNAFDKHMWNTTKTKLIFDSQAPSFQINELGPLMTDVIDLRMTVKNHAAKSKTVRLGFFVESAEGLIYSSFEDTELNDGLIELQPGEVREVRLQQPFPGISRNGNTLWFDVRSAGRPAKVLFRTRLIDFHSVDGGRKNDESFRERRLQVLDEMRPPRKDFDFFYDFSTYKQRIGAVVDVGIHGASKEAKSATEAKLLVMTDDAQERIVAEPVAPIEGNFATFLTDLKGKIAAGESYKVSVLLFDENKRIVGETDAEPFTYAKPKWMNNDLGTDPDMLWEPFTAIEKTPDGFETLKHRYTLGESGLPAQITIKPNKRELPLEHRDDLGADLSTEQLQQLGRGPQLRRPMRLEAVVGGQRVQAEVVEPAELVESHKSEFVYESKLKAGPVNVDLRTRYDADGSIHCDMEYGAEQSAKVELLELVTDTAGPVSIGFGFNGSANSMVGANRTQMTLPREEGVVWSSAETPNRELFYSRFMPWMHFGSGDRAFSWYCDSDQGWLIDKEGTTMTLERSAEGEVTWRTKFINHESDVKGTRSTRFHILVHPSKPEPENQRQIAWHYEGRSAIGYASEPIELSDEYLKNDAHKALRMSKGTPYEKLKDQGDHEPPWRRYGRWRNVGVTPEMDRAFVDKAVYYLERQIRVGRRHGWWWDEYWPVFSVTNDFADGDAYLRDPASVDEKELPWQAGFLTEYQRTTFKRLARIFKREGVPQRQYVWSNGEAAMLESFAWDTRLVEGAGAGNRSYELDNVVQYPLSMIRWLSKSNMGLICRYSPDATFAKPGDDPTKDRQIFGRALLHDIGVTEDGPHGFIQQPNHMLRLLKAMDEFGIYQEKTTEFIPYWRGRDLVRAGEVEQRFPHSEADQIGSKVYVSVYRRPHQSGGGQHGYKCLFVIQNEHDVDVELPLHLFDRQRLFGGPNTLTRGQARDRMSVPEELKGAWSKLSKRNASQPALMDAERKMAVARQSADGKHATYGPIHIRAHDYRILYGHFEPKQVTTARRNAAWGPRLAGESATTGDD